MKFFKKIPVRTASRSRRCLCIKKNVPGRNQVNNHEILDQPFLFSAAMQIRARCRKSCLHHTIVPEILVQTSYRVSQSIRYRLRNQRFSVQWLCFSDQNLNATPTLQNANYAKQSIPFESSHRALQHTTFWPLSVTMRVPKPSLAVRF